MTQDGYLASRGCLSEGKGDPITNGLREDIGKEQNRQEQGQQRVADHPLVVQEQYYGQPWNKPEIGSSREGKQEGDKEESGYEKVGSPRSESAQFQNENFLLSHSCFPRYPLLVYPLASFLSRFYSRAGGGAADESAARGQL